MARPLVTACPLPHLRKRRVVLRLDRLASKQARPALEILQHENRNPLGLGAEILESQRTRKIFSYSLDARLGLQQLVQHVMRLFAQKLQLGIAANSNEGRRDSRKTDSERPEQEFVERSPAPQDGCQLQSN